MFEITVVDFRLFRTKEVTRKNFQSQKFEIIFKIKTVQNEP